MICGKFSTCVLIVLLPSFITDFLIVVVIVVVVVVVVVVGRAQQTSFKVF